MIPRANITSWRESAPWPENAQVEQDLVLSRALITMYEHPIVAEQAVFRGGTALHKLFCEPPGRYSEDIDLVQRESGPIGPLVNAIREVLDPWLGEPKWKAGEGRFTLIWRFESTFSPTISMRLKVEINTREHFDVLGLNRHEYRIDNPWFAGTSRLTTYTLPELLGTKMRALFQRKKGRDLFDLWLTLGRPGVDAEQVILCFARYLEFGGTVVTRAQFESNMSAKMQDPAFRDDVLPLLRPGLIYDVDAAWSIVHEALVARLPGAPWKGAGDER